MVRYGRVDANQKEIVAALRAIPGCTVEILSDVGGGVPDLLVGFRGRNYLLECKDGEKTASQRQLNPLQVLWHEAWAGQKAVVKNVKEALAVIGVKM